MLQEIRVKRDAFVPAPAGACMMAVSFDTRPDAPALKSLHWQLTRSDTVDVAYERDSQDSGRSWPEPREVVLHCTRLFAAQKPDAPLDWTADAMQHRIAV
jgi:hypothetical protein